MMNFLDFINEKKEQTAHLININEAFKASDVNKVHKLATSLFKKHIEGNVLFDTNPYNTTISGKSCLTYFWYLIKDNKINTAWTFNYLVDNEVAEVYSIDFYDADNAQEVILNPKGAKTNLSIYTMGSSVAYFIPIIYDVVNNQDFKLDKRTAKKLTQKVFKESVQEDELYIGALKYNVYENLSDTTINETFMIEASEEARNYRRKKHEEVDAAYRDQVNATGDDKKAKREKWEKLADEYKAIAKAIKGGANTVEEIELAVKKNVKVTVNMPTADEKEKKIKEEPHDSPDVAFKKMQKYLKLVIKGLQNSIIICGAPGVGKTYNVKKQLKAAGYNEGHNLCTIKGTCRPRNLYLTLYDYRHKGDIVLIDDADALVGPHAPEDSLNILKAALDTTADDEGRLVTYGVAGPLKDDDGDVIDKRFYYNGAVIVLTNYQVGALNTALRGRAFLQDMNFTTQDILDRIKALLPDLEKQKCGMKAKIKAFDYLNKLLNEGAPMDLSMRGFVRIATLVQASESDSDWDEKTLESMIREQMKLMAERKKGNATY